MLLDSRFLFYIGTRKCDHFAMRGAPLSEFMVGHLVSTSTRAINNEYHLGLIAKNTEMLQREMVNLQRQNAEEALLHLHTVCDVNRQNRLNADRLDTLKHHAEWMVEEMRAIEGSLCSSIDHLTDT